MTIQVIIKNVYGEEKVYPVCDKAKVFAELLKQTTLTYRDIQTIKKLGYEVEVVTNQPTKL
jgi:hypothetical protein